MARHYISVKLINYAFGQTTTTAFPLISARATPAKIAADARKRFELIASQGSGHWIGRTYEFRPRGRNMLLTAEIPPEVDLLTIFKR